MFETLFSDIGPSVNQGLNRIIEAKASEAVARINRTSDMRRDTVMGANVTPVSENLQRDGNPIATAAGGIPTGWLFVGGIIAAAVLLRGLR